MSDNAWDAMRRALDEARNTISAADNAADAMAKMLRGRLRHVNSWVLEDLKRELRDFNMHTKEWKK